ncbi:hypothetical protein Droror1_Dr00020697 [Drosera rotundifolia]
MKDTGETTMSDSNVQSLRVIMEEQKKESPKTFVEVVADRVSVQNASMWSRNRNQANGAKLSYTCRRDEDIVITLDEVRPARQFWETSLIGYVIGDKILFKVMEGFVRNQWREVRLLEIFLHDKGYYIFKFNSKEDMTRVLEGNWFIYYKPFILRDWSHDFNFDDEIMGNVYGYIWIS